MKVRANDNVCEKLNRVDAAKEVEDTTPLVEISSDSAPSGEDNRRKSNKSKNYGKKFSARLYKYFSLWTFFIYYLNCLLRIGMQCAKYHKQNGINNFSIWWVTITDTSKWGDMFHSIFDWYTITLLVFLLLYSVVFLITFIRYSPKNKKTFKYFKKGFLMARRVIKLISVGLTLTVLVNSAQLATFSDKFMFVISLLSIMFTLMQICVSVTSWIIGKKLNRSVKQYVGNVMSNYIATARVRPLSDSTGKIKATVGDKLGKAKDRFLRTIETLTLSNEEAMRRAAELDGDVIDTEEITDRFENDYQPQADEAVAEEEQNKNVKKNRHNVKKDKRVILTKKEKQNESPKKIKLGIFGKEQEQDSVVSDVTKYDGEETDGDNDESTT